MFPLNAWYAAAYDVEVGRALLPRRICDIGMVFYRKEDGAPAALEDACWHRLLPLSLGRLDGDEVVCGYHGLVFNDQGRCTHMPSQETLNPSACVRAFPVVQRHRFVWVWPGDPVLADPALVPDLHWNDDPAWAGDGKRIGVKCNYRLVIDNLMDLTHETFVHGSSIGNRAVAEAPFVATHGDRSHGVTGMVLNTITPETAGSCHYFWAFARNYSLHEQRLTHELREGVASIFREDESILEAQQRAIDDHPGYRFYNLNIDAGALWARKMIDGIMQRERTVIPLKVA